MRDPGQRIHRGPVSQLFNNLHEDETTVIYSKTSYEKAKMVSDRVGLSLPDLYKFKCYHSSYIPFVHYNVPDSIAKVYVGFGGGTAIDIAKYLAKKNGGRCIAVPSMLSTNVFATDKVAEITPEGKETVDGVLPCDVWIDKTLLMESEEQNLCGFADVFSISTALDDWILAKDKGMDEIDVDIFQEACQTLFDAVGLVSEGYDQDKMIDRMFEILCKSGYITNDYGCGRPESGSEHILAKEIEKLTRVHHGVAVTCGIAVMGKVQPMSVVTQEIVPKALKKLGLYDIVKRDIPRDVLYKAISNVRPRLDRYTIIDYHTNLDKDFFVKNADLLIEESGLYD